MRSTSMTVVYAHPFRVAGYPDELPAGSYELLVQEQSLVGPRAETWKWTAAYLTVRGTTRKGGRTDRRPLNGADLALALSGRRTPALPPP